MFLWPTSRTSEASEMSATKLPANGFEVDQKGAAKRAFLGVVHDRKAAILLRAVREKQKSNLRGGMFQTREGGRGTEIDIGRN
ncbi:hypothetical protein EL22_11855 [Halostagnicola sp. A56]|nr:hypothetical protein EL22_11855 [Halostagnicola sp. A56]